MHPPVALHHHKVLHLFRIQLGLLGVTTLNEAAGTLTGLAKEGGTDTRDAWGCHLWLGGTCTEDSLQWRHLKYLQTLDACFFGTTLFFWMGGMAVN